MRKLVIALALTTLSFPALATEPCIVVATNPEMASGFTTLAECEKALGGPDTRQDQALGDNPNNLRGTLFNRAAGNTSRCEIVDGEPLIVVYPKGYEKEAQPAQGAADTRL